MVLEPKFVLLDEPTSALDMSVQAQIVDLLRDLQKKHDLAYLFISHDLKVVRALSNYVVVLKNGKVVEEGPADEVFAKPKAAYTKALLAAAFDLKWRSGRCSRPERQGRAWGAVCIPRSSRCSSPGPPRRLLQTC
jgi:microcin C transport system ATP-binding protein